MPALDLALSLGGDTVRPGYARCPGRRAIRRDRRRCTRHHCRSAASGGYDLAPDLLGDAVPDAPRPGRTVAQSLRPAGSVKIVPAVERGPWDAELLQGSANRQVGLLDQADDLGLFGCGVSHAASPPSPIMLFLSRRFSRVRSATDLLQGGGLPTQLLHLVRRGSPRRVAGEPLLARLKEVLRPAIIHRRGDALAA